MRHVHFITARASSGNCCSPCRLRRSLAAGLSTAAAAQQSASPPNVLPTIVISPTSVPTPEAQIASSVTVITAQDIEREQRRTVPDILANVPGLNIVQTGGPGGQTSVFMRGTNSNHVKVLIDGIDVSDPSNAERGRSNSAICLPTDIERIEVLRGPQSGLYGADAIGGVISIITKRGQGPAKVTGHGRGRLVRDLQPGRQPQRLEGQLRLRVQRRALPRRRHAGDAAEPAAARTGCDRQFL